MKIIDLIHQLLPSGPEAYASKREGHPVNYNNCPTWPVDLFAVARTIIERSGCYTMATPDRRNLYIHEVRLEEIRKCADLWNSDINDSPGQRAVLDGYMHKAIARYLNDERVPTGTSAAHAEITASLERMGFGT